MAKDAHTHPTILINNYTEKAVNRCHADFIKTQRVSNYEDKFYKQNTSNVLWRNLNTVIPN